MTDSRPAGSKRARTGADAHRTTADRDTTDTTAPDTRQMTDTTDTTETDAQPGTRQKMKEIDHTPPVEGARRAFERRDEGRPARPDGGKPDESEEASDEDDETTADGGFSQKMKEMDHTPPVDGANRTFERGKDDDDDDDDVAE